MNKISNNCSVEDSLKTPLLYNEAPIGGNYLGNNILELRTKGFTILRNVFERDSVDAYREAVEEELLENDEGRDYLPEEADLALAPILAPRLREILPHAVSKPPIIVHATLDSYIQSISKARKHKPAKTHDPHKGWHKDGRHYIEGPVEPYFNMVSVTTYLRDLDEDEDGPTQVVVGSHLCNDNPFHGDGRVQAIRMKKQDLLIWIQKVWHRPLPRLKEGNRYFFLYRFVPPVIDNEILTELPPPIKRLWDATDDPALKFYLGGLYQEK